MTKLFHTLINMYPFYKKARDLWTDTQVKQIIKGLEKYPEPFTPNHWTPQELLDHALEESVDLTHYLVGLKELLDERDTYITQLETEIERLRNEREPNPHQEIFDALEDEFNKKPPYSDLDD